MSAPLLLDLSHTSHTRARTGIQRVTRSLHRTLGADAIPITHDPYRRMWRTLERWEHSNLSTEGAAATRGARWPLVVRLRGRLRRAWSARRSLEPKLAPLARDASGLLVPELFSPAAARAHPALFAATRGPRVALFHDAIALQLPELTPAKTVARFPAYLTELLAFDGIAAVSEDSRATLLAYWDWLGVREIPRVAAIGLGLDRARPAAGDGDLARRTDAPTPPTVLSVGSLEGRKNHLALLEACEQLWSRGSRFSLHLIGLPQPQTAAPALARIRSLQARGRALRYDGPVDDAALEAAYTACTFTVYPSLLEGFGLPVLESLAHGRPCICSAQRALGEAARGGGCVALERVDVPSLATALAGLLASPAEIESLAREARARSFRSWADYIADLRAWMREIPTS